MEMEKVSVIIGVHCPQRHTCQLWMILQANILVLDGHILKQLTDKMCLYTRKRRLQKNGFQKKLHRSCNSNMKLVALSTERAKWQWCTNWIQTSSLFRFNIQKHVGQFIRELDPEGLVGRKRSDFCRWKYANPGGILSVTIK